MGWFRNKGECAYAFTSGRTVPLSEVKDDAFSQGLLGKGIAMLSEDGRFYSPVSGTVTMVFPTMHAIGIRSEGGSELVLHVGIDTVKLDGTGFTAYVKDGYAVKRGDLLLEADLARIEAEGYDPTAILVVTDPLDAELHYSGLSECQARTDWLFQIKTRKNRPS